MSVGRTAKCTGPPRLPKTWSLNASSSPEERNGVKRRSSRRRKTMELSLCIEEIAYSIFLA
eukprot:scaffold126341_cov78-Phaeocystis_antarctica.AAC.1